MTQTLSWCKLLRWWPVHPKVARGQMSTERSQLPLLLGNSGCSITGAKQVGPLPDLLRSIGSKQGLIWPAGSPTLAGCTAPVVEVDYAPRLLGPAHAHPPPSLTPCPGLTLLQEVWSASASHFWTPSLTTSVVSLAPRPGEAPTATKPCHEPDAQYLASSRWVARDCPLPGLSIFLVHRPTSCHEYPSASHPPY